MFEDLLSLKGSGTPYDRLTPITEAERDRLTAMRFSLPADYLAFLSEIGWGSLSSGSLMLYSGLLDPVEVYGDRPDLPQGLKLFGDDFGGHNVGFHSGGAEVVEVEPSTMELTTVADSFSDFVRSRISEAE